MIRYRLQCKDGHEFEAWFRSSSDYDKQVKRHDVTCPDCGSAKVSKTLMAPKISTSSRARTRAIEAAEAQAETAKQATPPPTAPAPAPVVSEEARQVEMRRQFLALMRHVRSEVEKKAEYVGDRFADEARKIHYEETEPRGIYGETTLEEARKLDEEGIDVLPLPRLPEEQN